MKIAIDMDNTLFDEFGRDVRPGIMKLLADLKEDGHELVLWTSSSKERAVQIMSWHSCNQYFSAFYFREDYDPKNTGAIKDLSRIGADAIIDDDPKHCRAAEAGGKIGILVKSFRGGTISDADELIAVRKRLRPQQSWFTRLWK